jgi:hypothetical protein
VLPDALCEAAQTARYRQTARQGLAERQLCSLAELAREIDSPVVVVKGPVVAHAYPSPELRSYGDIDLFVEASATSTLAALLERAGYRALVTGDRSTHLTPMEPPAAGFRVEVHGLPYDDFSFAPLQPWQRYPGLWAPDHVQHFLYLVHHAVWRHELSSGLLHLVDLKFWTATWTDAEWMKAQALAENRGCERMVGLALALLPLTGLVMLTSEPQYLFPSPPQAIVDAAGHVIMGDKPCVMPRLGRDLEDRSVRGWLRYAKLVLLGDPRTRQNLSWPEHLLFYVRRPFRLLKNYAPLFLRLLRRDPQSRRAMERQNDLMTWLRGD